MSAAYVDTSALAAIVFNEPHAAAITPRLNKFDRLLSSNLLEAELRSACVRENLGFQERILLGIDWILPDRNLTPEFRAVLQAGHLRGADLWHVATALFVSSDPATLAFATLDAQQAAVADALGFAIVGVS